MHACIHTGIPEYIILTNINACMHKYINYSILECLHSCTHKYINSSDEHVYNFADSDDDSDDDVPDLMDPDDSDIYDDIPDLELHEGNLEVPVAPAA